MVKLLSNFVNAAPQSDKKHCRYRIEHLRDFFINNAKAPKRAEPKIDKSPRACLRREYETYLTVQRGLAERTIGHSLRFYDLFLTEKFGNELGNLNSIKPDDIINFILKMREKSNAPRDKTIPSHLRSLFKFLFWSGRTKRNLSDAVPRVRNQMSTNIPRYLQPEQVNQLLDSVRDHNKTGRRDYAMLLLVARLGLRAMDVTAIELEDIDWRSGQILIRGKGKLRDKMPMPVEVGKAIVEYLKKERRGDDRALFVSTKPPFKRFRNVEVINTILKNAYTATRINPPQSYIGSHVLRHSLATDMLRKGATLNEIGDVLRHRSSMITTIYAQHDVETLRSISKPWPCEGDVE